jgi:cytidylate kinase
MWSQEICFLMMAKPGGLISLPTGTCLHSEMNSLWQRSAENIQDLSSSDADRGMPTPFVAIQHRCCHIQFLSSQLAYRAYAALLFSSRPDMSTIVSTLAGEISQMVRSARIDSRFKTTSYLVLGPAGSGKSTLVQHLIDKVCFKCATSRLLILPSASPPDSLLALLPRQLKALNERASQHALMHATVTGVSGAGSARYLRGRSLSSVLHTGTNVRHFWATRKLRETAVAFAGRINGQEGRQRRLENGKYERVNGGLGIRKEECWCKRRSSS